MRNRNSTRTDRCTMAASTMIELLTLLQYIFICIFTQVSSLDMQSFYPKPALFDMQLTSSIRVTVEFSAVTQDVHTKFTFHPHSECVNGESYNYTVLIWQDELSKPCHIEGPFLVSTCERVMDVTAYGLQRSQHYTAIVVTYNKKISLKSKKFDIYTSAVQEVEVVQGEECVSVTCYFAAGSNAQGCVVHMTIVTTHSSQHLHSWQFNVTQDPVQLKGTLHVPLEPRTSAVDVSVYDLTATGRIGFLSVPPRLIHSTGTNCNLVDTLTPFRAKAKMVLFYISASFFIIGLLIIFVGMLCKVGRLHRHFHNKSYEILEGSTTNPSHYRNSTSYSGQSQNKRRHTQPEPTHTPSSLKPRAKTYGSYEILRSSGIKQGRDDIRVSADIENVSVSLTPNMLDGGSGGSGEDGYREGYSACDNHSDITTTTVKKQQDAKQYSDK